MRICFFGKPDAAQMRRIVAALADRGHRIHVVYRGPGEIAGATYEPFAIPPVSLLHPQRYDGRRRRYLTRFLRAFDVVSIQFLHSWGFTPTMMEQGCFTVRPWGSDICPPPTGPQPGEETVERRRTMLRRATAVSAACASFREAIAAYAGIPADGIELTPLGVDLDRFRPQSRPADAPVVGFIKGFGHAYGPQHLIRAMPEIIARRPDVRFELVGDGPLLASCQALAGELGVDGQITWRPRCAPDDVPALMGRWSVSVIPSLVESFCIAALEAAAMGIPVVGSRVGGLKETVRDGETGVLVAPGDSSALAEAIVGLLDDEGRRRALGRAGRAFVAEHYAWDQCVDRWEAFFEAARGRVCGALAGV